MSLIVSPNIADLSYGKPASTRTSRDRCHARGNDKRDAVYLWSFSNTSIRDYEVLFIESTLIDFRISELVLVLETNLYYLHIYLTYISIDVW